MICGNSIGQRKQPDPATSGDLEGKPGQLQAYHSAPPPNMDTYRSSPAEASNPDVCGLEARNESVRQLMRILLDSITNSETERI